jgi:uncharacterized protein (TIGR02217 family)
MTARFIDVALDDCVPGYPAFSSPRWSTRIVMVDSGAEQVNQRWEHPLHAYTLPEAVREHEVFEAIHDHWLVMRGPVHTFPFRDPLDFASVALAGPNTAPTVSGLDQVIGTGDGTTLTYQLTKTYTRGPESYTRNVYHPVVSSVVVTVGGADPLTFSPPLTWSVDRLTGGITFDAAPDNGDVIRAGYLYDVEVRFESDEAFDGIVRTFGLGGFADINLIEVRPCG